MITGQLLTILKEKIARFVKFRTKKRPAEGQVLFFTMGTFDFHHSPTLPLLFDQSINPH
jgi:hypothetical protein